MRRRGGRALRELMVGTVEIADQEAAAAAAAVQYLVRSHPTTAGRLEFFLQFLKGNNVRLFYWT